MLPVLRLGQSRKPVVGSAESQCYFRNMFEKSTDTAMARTGLVLTAVAVVQFMVSLDLSVVNVGLPRIATGLGFSALGLTWVIHAYALTFGGLLLLGGKAADRYGRRRVLLLGTRLFGLASLAGGFAQEPGQLVAARAVQGIGAATLAPAALSLLTATFPAGRHADPRLRSLERDECRGRCVRCPRRRPAHPVRRLALGDVRQRPDGRRRAGPGLARRPHRLDARPRRPPGRAGCSPGDSGNEHCSCTASCAPTRYPWSSR